jgi:hypothetical protein
MRNWRWAAGLTVLGLLLLTARPAHASRTPDTRVPTFLNNGARGDITVPYTTNGISTLGVANGVAPYYVATPNVNDPRNPGTRPVFNVYSFYGATKLHGATEGAAPRGTPIPGQR